MDNPGMQMAYQPPPAYPPAAAHQQVTVVVEQPLRKSAAAPQNIREWSSGLCACCDDIGVCCYAAFCHACFLCDLSQKMNENPCGPYCCGMVFVVAMRTKLRTMYGINGTICGDVCTTACCELCATTQMMREWKMQNFA